MFCLSLASIRPPGTKALELNRGGDCNRVPGLCEELTSCCVAEHSASPQRHSLATFLVNRGTDVKTVQGLLRHANVTTTLGRYAQSVNASMLAAQETMLQAMKSDSKAVD